jgi:hypothetical protein
MIVATNIEPQYTESNEIIGITLEVQNRGKEDKRAEIVVYVSEKSQSITDNIFKKKDSINIITTDIIPANSSQIIDVQLRKRIILNRGVVLYGVEIKEIVS